MIIFNENDKILDVQFLSYFLIIHCRDIAVCHPLKRSVLCTEGRSKFVIAMLVVLTGLSQVFRLVMVEYIPGQKKPCNAPDQPVERRLFFYDLDYFFSNLTLRFFIPTIIILICNGLIVFNIRRKSPARRSMTAWEQRKTRSAIYTLFLICAVFVFTLAPEIIVAVYHSISHATQDVEKVSATYYHTLRPLSYIFQMLKLVNYSINFVLYGLTGRQFRQAIKMLIRRKMGCEGCTRERESFAMWQV